MGLFLRAGGGGGELYLQGVTWYFMTHKLLKLT